MLYHCVPPRLSLSSLFFFNDTATTEIYTLSLHDALPIYLVEPHLPVQLVEAAAERREKRIRVARRQDRKSTRLNSSHGYISYAVFCLKKKKTKQKKSVLSDPRTIPTDTRSKVAPTSYSHT